MNWNPFPPSSLQAQPFPMPPLLPPPNSNPILSNVVFMDGGATSFTLRTTSVPFPVRRCPDGEIWIIVVGMSFLRHRRSACFDSDLLSRSVHGLWASEVGLLSAVIKWVNCCYNAVCGGDRPTVFLSGVSSIRGGRSNVLTLWSLSRSVEICRCQG